MISEESENHSNPHTVAEPRLRFGVGAPESRSAQSPSVSSTDPALLRSTWLRDVSIGKLAISHFGEGSDTSSIEDKARLHFHSEHKRSLISAFAEMEEMLEDLPAEEFDPYAGPMPVEQIVKALRLKPVLVQQSDSLPTPTLGDLDIAWDNPQDFGVSHRTTPDVSAAGEQKNLMPPGSTLDDFLLSDDEYAPSSRSASPNTEDFAHLQDDTVECERAMSLPLKPILGEIVAKNRSKGTTKDSKTKEYRKSLHYRKGSKDAMYMSPGKENRHVPTSRIRRSNASEANKLIDLPVSSFIHLHSQARL